MTDFLSDEALEKSAVVSNCRMNRERKLAGSNGYAREIGFNPLDYLRETAMPGRWLDLCCGTGKALVEAVQIAEEEGWAAKIEIVGVDLVGLFAPLNPKTNCLSLVETSLVDWQPDGEFDLITCVHGLHYIGDKLGLVQRAVSWLRENGKFAANLDIRNIKIRDCRAAGRFLAKELRKQGLGYDFRRKRIVCEGQKNFHLPFQYLGADDQAGPNYTGQAAVDSYYERAG